MFEKILTNQVPRYRHLFKTRNKDKLPVPYKATRPTKTSPVKHKRMLYLQLFQVNTCRRLCQNRTGKLHFKTQMYLTHQHI